MFSWENLNLKILFINRLCLLLLAVNVIWLLKILPKTVKCPKKKQEPLLISTIYLMLKHLQKQVKYDFRCILVPNVGNKQSSGIPKQKLLILTY